ncbi:HRDC domain-containing protein, partial [Streptomyces sp. NPDC007325]|uniref:HRDC domain-containing protein n=1 Tax=Streptomyces sp. NPDC007325 TaxID=3154588 RepID=UPI00340E223D
GAPPWGCWPRRCGVGRGGPAGEGARRRPRGPVRCRVCGTTLTEAGAMKLLRCEDCPSDMDEGLYERLWAWREERARALGQPAYCVFTEKTLMAIAERVPSSGGELAMIAGVGARKLDRFGADVLAICAGEEGVTGTDDV